MNCKTELFDFRDYNFFTLQHDDCPSHIIICIPIEFRDFFWEIKDFIEERYNTYEIAYRFTTKVQIPQITNS